MSDSSRARIHAAFDEELGATPVPDGLRALSVRNAVNAPRERSPQPALLALVAAVVMIALIATLVIGSNALRHNVSSPARSRPAPSLLPPSPRAGAGMVYDPAHGELVLFGGTDVNGKTVNETWTWDGKSWRLYHLATAPAARHDFAMAYDPARSDVVLFGGIAQVSGTGPQTQVQDTWSWNGSTWKELHPAHEPAISADWPAEMSYDPSSKRVVLWGFEKTTSGNQTLMPDETWLWNGTDWTRAATSTGPTVPATAMVDTGSGLYLMSTPAERVGGRYVAQMWRWDGGAWTVVASFAQPADGSMAFDAGRNKTVAFEGDTWTWDGTSWTRQHPTAVPPSVGYMAYFPPLHEVVMWGDLTGDTNNDVWGWDGSDWHQLAAGTTPPIPAPAGQFGPDTPAAAAIFIRQTVKTASPLLLPTSLPAGMEASGVATADSFSIDYKSDQRDETISLQIAVANPPPGDAKSSDTRVRFRNSLAAKNGTPGQAEYFVYDPSLPRSDRWLMWIEPGQVSSNIGGLGVPYFLFASGLTDAEFWQVANSLG